MTDKKPRVDKSGARIYKPDFALKKKVGMNISIAHEISEERLAKAQKFIDTKKGEYNQEGLKEVVLLRSAFREFCKNLDFDNSDKRCSEYKLVLNITLNIKSNSGMYDYPLATDIAKTLFEYMMECKNLDQKFKDVVNVHISALGAIFAHKIKDSDEELSQKVLNSLSEATST